jgi:excisionase family DNA binding protein
MTTATLPAADYPWPDQPADTLRPLNEVPEVAQYLRCGRTHVFALIRSGALGSVKVGRKRLIPATAVHAYLASLDGQE